MPYREGRFSWQTFHCVLCVPKSRVTERLWGRTAPCQDAAEVLTFFGRQRPLFVKMFMKIKVVRREKGFFSKNLSS